MDEGKARRMDLTKGGVSMNEHAIVPPIPPIQPQDFIDKVNTAQHVTQEESIEARQQNAGIQRSKNSREEDVLVVNVDSNPIINDPKPVSIELERDPAIGKKKTEE